MRSAYSSYSSRPLTLGDGRWFGFLLCFVVGWLRFGEGCWLVWFGLEWDGWVGLGGYCVGSEASSLEQDGTGHMWEDGTSHGFFACRCSATLACGGLSSSSSLLLLIMASWELYWGGLFNVGNEGKAGYQLGNFSVLLAGCLACLMACSDSFVAVATRT